jgi:hypothetical protein
MGVVQTAIAWAVIWNGVPRPNSVCDTRRGAIVNWLGTDGGFRVTADWSDEAIEAVWEQARWGVAHDIPEADVAQVEIRRVLN